MLARILSVVERIVPLPISSTREGLIVTAGVSDHEDNSTSRREPGHEPRTLEACVRITLERERLLPAKHRTLNQTRQERNRSWKPERT